MARKARRKGESGYATTYISRTNAVKKLQLNLKDFRRLCILKGIYPHEPKSKKNVKGSQNSKTFYYVKDINFLSHEPIIQKFRDFRTFIKKLKRARGRDDREAEQRLHNNKPIYKLDHIVKERYPTFVDSLRDLDDPLSMCSLFATFPKLSYMPTEIIDLCRRLTIEFMHYVIESKSLRKVFISIKGYYYQAEIQGQTITWVVPHNFVFSRPAAVDFRIMTTFTDFYVTMLGFVNYKLYSSMNLHYPPSLAVPSNSKDEDDTQQDGGLQESVAALNQKLKAIITDNVDDEEAAGDDIPMSEDVDQIEQMKKEQESLKNLQNLFTGLKFFINREVPRESLTFVIRSFGGQVSWDKTLYAGATFDESDESITHQIVDRPNHKVKYISRYCIQPQWVYDCVNARTLLPVQDYFVGVVLPAHLSPFVVEKQGDYVPPEKLKLLARQSANNSDDELNESDEELPESEETEQQPDEADESDEADDLQPKMNVSAGKATEANANKIAEKNAAEEKRLAVMMIPKKKKRLYDRIMHGKKRKNREAEKLRARRDEYERNKKRQKT